jgi:S-adenosylmethionine-dependent methyltransferase
MDKYDTRLVHDYYDSTAEDYDSSYDMPYWKLYNEITWANIQQFLPQRKNACILDAGGGTGYWAIRLAHLGYHIELTDISENMLKVAKRKIANEQLQESIDTHIVDIRDMSSYSSNSFDMALAEGDSVSYCLDPQKAVSELARVVKPNASVIISVDNKYAFLPHMIQRTSFSEISNFLKTGMLEVDFPIQAFTPEELQTLLETCGLNVVSIIGKPIFTQLMSQLIPREQRETFLTTNFREILSLELKYCDVQSLVGIGGHLEIVGRKKKL